MHSILANHAGKYIHQYVRPCHTVSHLADKVYWDNRYQEKQQLFDWLSDGDSTLENVLPFLKPGVRILDVGCGISSFALKLCKTCPVPVQIVCLDFSRQGLHLSRQLCKAEICNGLKGISSSLHFVQADASNMPFKSEAFEVILDKGTTDSVLKMDDDEEAYKLAKGILSESLRLLSSTGVYLQITDEDPDLRMMLLQDLLSERSDKGNVSISHKKISDDGNWEHFMYEITMNKS